MDNSQIIEAWVSSSPKQQATIPYSIRLLTQHHGALFFTPHFLRQGDSGQAISSHDCGGRANIPRGVEAKVEFSAGKMDGAESTKNQDEEAAGSVHE